jgi:hypothetical protein
MKITYDPPPARPGWLSRLVESALVWLLGLLAAVLPRAH